MKLTKFLTIVIFITMISLFYVHQQVELIKFSYKIQSNQKTLDDLLDQTKILEYNVIALKAPTSLENRLEAHDVKLISPERWQVIYVASSERKKEDAIVEGSMPRMKSFLKSLTSEREAEAKPTN